jgi:hypothetical protein
VPDSAPAAVPGFENWGLGSASEIERMEGEDKVSMLRFGFLRLMGSRWREEAGEEADLDSRKEGEVKTE